MQGKHRSAQDGAVLSSGMLYAGSSVSRTQASTAASRGGR